MEHLTYNKAFKIGGNELHFLADELYSYFNKQIAFSRLMRIIKTTGKQCVRELFEEVKKSEAENRLSLFLWKIKNTKIKWL